MLLRSWRVVTQRLSHMTQLRAASTCGSPPDATATRHQASTGHMYQPPPTSIHWESSAPMSESSSPELGMLFSSLHISDLSSASANSPASQPVPYVLPTTSPSAISRKTIIDPQLVSLFYNLPTSHSIVQEKVEPNGQTVPVLDPRNVVTKHARAKLLIIRHKKMKKHKLKKFRKRMIYVHRALAAEKKKKRELMLQTQLKGYITRAEEYDPEEEVTQRIKDAKLGGWSIDTVHTWKNQKHV